MFNGYRQLFQVRGGLRFSASAFVLRLPISMMYLALALFIVDEKGSYALAGSLSMAASVVLAIATPLWSRAADQYGQSTILKITAPIHLLFLGLFVYLVKSGAPTWQWFLAALIFECFVIGAGQMVRRRWIYAVGDNRQLIDTAYSFEAFVDEIIFTTGPVIVAILAARFSPAVAIFVAMSSVAVGTLLFLRQKETEPPRHPREDGEDHSLLIRKQAIQALFIPMMLCGAFFSSTGLVIVGYADKFGVRDYSGFLIAIWSLGSGIAALVSGTITWKASEKTRFLFFLTLLFLLTLPIYLVVHLLPGNHAAMSIALFCNGIAIAPLLTAGFTVAEKSVSEKRTTEVLAWAISALNLGGALPTALTGYIIDNYGVTVAFAIPVGCMLISVLSLLPFANYWRGKVGATA